jgi:hypothetical protein
MEIEAATEMDGTIVVTLPEVAFLAIITFGTVVIGIGCS